MKKKILFIVCLFLSTFVFAEKYFVCLGSYAIEQNAIELQNKLKAESVKTFIDEGTSKTGVKVFRVLLDIPKDYIEDARNLRDKVQKSTIAKKLNLTGLWVLQSSHESKSTEKKMARAVRKETKLETNKEIPVSKEKPYSLLIESYKEEQAANNDKERLQEKDIDAYVLKKFRENENFTFDLHAGSEENEDNLDDLKTKLDDLHITYETADYNDFADQIEKYNDIVQTQDVVSDDGIYEIPKSISENVKEIIRDFPINKNFQIEDVLIVDFDNIMANWADNDISFDLVDEFILDERPSAGSSVRYKDKLFNKTVEINIAIFKNDVSEEMLKVMSELEAKDEFFRKQNFAIKNGTLNSWIGKYEDEFKLFGISNDNRMVITLKAPNFSESEFVEFVENSFNDSNLLVYPQIRKTLCILPDDEENVFLSYTLKQIGMNYVKEKNYADWAWGIYGHWNAEFYFVNDTDYFDVGLFDLDYDYNAAKIHKIFMDEKREGFITEDNHFKLVNGREGWYLKNYWSKELSFANNSYIVAIDTHDTSYITESDLEDIADELKIW